MEMLAGAVIVTMPFAVIVGLLAWAERRDRNRRRVEARQIALTDAIHERFGAVAAPLVRRAHHGWQVRLAVPFDRPIVTQALVAVVWEALASCSHDSGRTEIVLTRRLRVDAESRRKPAVVVGG